MHAFVRRTDGQTDGQTDRRTDRIPIAIPRLHSMQRGKNVYKNRLRLAKVIVKNKMSRFYGSLCISETDDFIKSYGLSFYRYHEDH